MSVGIKLKPLLVVSVFIVISDLLFIVVNYCSALNAVQDDTRRWAREVQHVFSLSLEEKATSMQQIASFIANIPEVKTLFYQGKKIHDQAGREAGKTDLALVRSQLYSYVKPSWEKMSSRYDVRQLHFHFGPGSTSFLRAHRPEKFGDNMDEVRFTVADVNEYFNPVKGFETGRVYSGIRGVVPVDITVKPDQSVHVGALEAGTSFSVMLRTLQKELDCDIAVLLTEEHVRRNMWPDFVATHFSDDEIIGTYFIEATTSPDFRRFLARKEVLGLLDAGTGSDFTTGGQVLQIGVFPLRDYRGTNDPALPDSGAVVVWKDAAEKWALLRRGLLVNIVYSLVALVVVEGVLIIGWRLSQRHLNNIIQSQTCKLREMASQDGLTGVLNRRGIEKGLVDETSRSLRHDSPFSVIMFDIDHFKKVNDTYGHGAGDEVLKKVCACVANLVRTTDKVGRWGGEEFLVLAPETPARDAEILGERIREAVAAIRYAQADPVTISLGIAQHRDKETAEALVHRADAALYRAKEGGRNKAVMAG